MGTSWSRREVSIGAGVLALACVLCWVGSVDGDAPPPPPRPGVAPRRPAEPPKPTPAPPAPPSTPTPELPPAATPDGAWRVERDERGQVVATDGPAGRRSA